MATSLRPALPFGDRLSGAPLHDAQPHRPAGDRSAGVREQATAVSQLNEISQLHAQPLPSPEAAKAMQQCDAPFAVLISRAPQACAHVGFLL